MEENDVLRNAGGVKPTIPGKSTARTPSSFRRHGVTRTPRRESRSAGTVVQWLRNSRIFYWLLLITFWTYLGFYFQSSWAHKNEAERLQTSGSNLEQKNLENGARHFITNETVKIKVEDARRMSIAFTKKPVKKSAKIPSRRRMKKRNARRRRNVVPKHEAEEEPEIPMNNSTYGFLVGPFGVVEDEILEWSPEKRSGTCIRKGEFARLVWSRRVLLIFHDFSMTGAPLSMLELATELTSCGAAVSVVAVSRKGGLMTELHRRKIKVLDDKLEEGFKAGRKVDLIIAGSAVCASWIDQFIADFPPGGSKIAWWIMENRREYFDRAKNVLDRVKTVIFLSNLQSEVWLTWCKEANVKLRYPPAVVPLSVNDELAFAAGIPCTLNTPSFTPEVMIGKRKLLRSHVRQSMGLTDDDVLFITLSSINPGKGQLLLVETIGSMIDQGPSRNVKLLIGSVGSKGNKPSYVEEILKFISSHPKMNDSVIWSRSTSRVAALYAAADVYAMSSQGMGETFGRVTIEAMAFNLPVVGTDAGGTREIVEKNVTGLLYPVGRVGTPVLAENFRFLLRNSTVREEMGNRGRKKVKQMYLKRHMFKKLGEVLYKTMT